MSNTIIQALGLRRCVDPQGRLTEDTANSLPALVVTTGTDFQATHAYLAGDVVYPVSSNTNPGREFLCTTPGTSGGSAPTWSDTVGATTASGGAIFTARAVEFQHWTAGVLTASGMPAHTLANGSEFWYTNGLLNRTDGTAVNNRTVPGGSIVSSAYYVKGVLLDATNFALVQSILSAGSAETATLLEFNVQPTSVAHGAHAVTPSVVVRCKDGNGNTVTSLDGTTIFLQLIDGAVGSVLTGSTAALSSGLATFSSLEVSLADPDNFLQASGLGLAGVLSAVFPVT